jgi:PAS domain S-box-containing protein
MYQETTARMEYEENLRKFQLAVDNASDHIIITDHEGKILFANKAASKITGYEIKEIIGQTPRLWGGLMPKSYYEKMWKTIKEDKKTFTGEIKNKRKSGEEYIAAVSISPVLSKRGNLLFFVGIERDITKEKEVDRAKTEFVSLASHQLRTPLSIISWYTEMLLDGEKGKLNDGQEKYLAEVNKGNQRMIDLVNALLNVSRIDMGTFMVEPQPEDIREIADSAYNDFKIISSQKGVALEKEYSGKLPKISLDKSLVRIIFQNLLSNAVKYTPKGGKVSLKISANDKEKSALIEVSDTGYGIPESQQDKIFTKLFRADNAQEIDPDGTGLGLYIAKAIVKAANGEIWFVSEEGKGTTFYVTIPFSGMERREGTKGLSNEPKKPYN